MGYKNITVGNKIAKAINARIIEADNKNAYKGMEVEFEFMEPSTETRERLTRIFWWSNAAITKSMETLVEILHYNGCLDTDHNGIIEDPEAIRSDDVQIVIEMQQSTKDDNKEYPIITWVNNIGGSQSKGIAKKDIKTKILGETNFKSAFAFAVASKGKPPEKKKANTQTREEFVPDEEIDELDIPF